MAKKRTTIIIEEKFAGVCKETRTQYFCFFGREVERVERIVQGTRFELAKAYATGPSSLRL